MYHQKQTSKNFQFILMIFTSSLNLFNPFKKDVLNVQKPANEFT